MHHLLKSVASGLLWMYLINGTPVPIRNQYCDSTRRQKNKSGFNQIIDLLL